MTRPERRRFRFVLAAAALLTAAAAPFALSSRAQNPAPPPPGPPAMALTPAATVTHKPLDEMSGIVQSRRYPGVFWVHNDSGDRPRLFAIRGNGEVIVPSWLKANFSTGPDETAEKPAYPGFQVDMAANFDWEDIAIDGDTLYVADAGNNGNARRDLGVYVVAEPNPEAVEKGRALKWLPVAYEDQAAFPPAEWRFDCEAVFVKNGKLYFVTKHRANGNINAPAVGANLYRMDTTYTDRPNILKKIDGAADLGGWVTAADLSPDGRTLAVLCQAPAQSVWLFEARDGDKFFAGKARRMAFTGGRQCEAVCWEDDKTLLITNEQRDVFRVKAADARAVSATAR